MPEKELTEDECTELMFLFRVVRAGNERPGERDRLKELMRRHEATFDRSKIKKVSDG